METPASDRQKIACATRALRAWERADWDATAEAFSPDGVLEAATGRPVVGRRAIREALDVMAAGVGEQDLQLLRVGTIDGRVFEQRHDVVIVNGARGEIPTVGVLTIENDQIVRWTDYVDRAMLREHHPAPVTPVPDTDRAAGDDTDEQKIATAVAMIEAWSDRDWDRAADLFAERGVLHHVMQEAVVGRQAFRAELASMYGGLEHIETQINTIGIIDDRVFVERVDMFDAGGQRGELPVMGVFGVRDRQVYEWLEYYDRRTWLRAAGQLPPRVS